MTAAEYKRLNQKERTNSATNPAPFDQTHKHLGILSEQVAKLPTQLLEVSSLYGNRLPPTSPIDPRLSRYAATPVLLDVQKLPTKQIGTTTGQIYGPPYLGVKFCEPTTGKVFSNPFNVLFMYILLPLVTGNFPEFTAVLRRCLKNDRWWVFGARNAFGHSVLDIIGPTREHWFHGVPLALWLVTQYVVGIMKLYKHTNLASLLRATGTHVYGVHRAFYQFLLGKDPEFENDDLLFEHGTLTFADVDPLRYALTRGKLIVGASPSELFEEICNLTLRNSELSTMLLADPIR